MNIESKVVIIDCDSFLYMVSYAGKDMFGEPHPDYEESDYEFVESKLSEMIHSILNIIEQSYGIERVYMCVKGKGNFRRDLYPAYKAHRPESKPIIDHLCEFLIREFKAIPSHGAEADDMIYSISKAIDHTGIIVGIDKDLRQIPSMFFDYQKNLFYRVTEEEAKYNLAIQILIGDPSDGINLTPKFGIKRAQKVIFKGMTDYQYLKAIYSVYRGIWGDSAKGMIRLAYKLLKLKEVEYNNGEAQS